ncbi:MAG: DUF2141 domain-containing protein [Pseudomonadota bacterium]|nr:DUF2141 domain-containing protein [Pseudomonadota bacterium]
MIMNTNQPNPPSLVVRVSGFKHAGGRAIAKLYRPGDNVLAKEGSAMARVEIRDGVAECAFFGLPEGPYAVVAFHDENDNGVVDHRLGLPSEPIGFSNGFRLSLLSGRPTFEKLRFELRRPSPEVPMTLAIEVR